MAPLESYTSSSALHKPVNGSGVCSTQPDIPQGHSLLQTKISFAVQTALDPAVTIATTDTPNSSESEDVLSAAEQQELFAALETSLKKPESLTEAEGAPSFESIQAALIKNSTMMCNLYNLQQHGAELVITHVNKDGSILLADAARDLDIEKQEAALQALTAEQRNTAIDTILSPIADEESEEARTWFLAQLEQHNDARGLNFAEALLYAVAHGGTLISYELYDDAIAKRDASVYEPQTWTWYFKQLSTVISSGYAPFGFRNRGEADRRERLAGVRCVVRGGRVAGLRVQIS